MTTGTLHQGERGSITVFFCIFVLVLMGALSYSLYVGQQVERREVLQSAADAATVSVANHAATGVNMIAANNLAVASAIHIGGSVAILAAYGSLARAAGYDFIDTIKDGVKIVAHGTTNIQTDVWDPLSHVTGVFLRAASGLTTFNEVLKKAWFVGGTLRGVEVARLNVPGSVGLPVMRSSFSPLLMLKGVKQSLPEETVCHAIKGSKAVDKGQRDSIIRWLSGPFATLGVGVVNQILDVLGKVQDLAHKVMPVRIGFHRCGYGIKISLLDALDLFGGAAGGGADRNNTIESASGDATLNQDEIGDITAADITLIRIKPFASGEAATCHKRYTQALRQDVINKALNQPNSALEKAIFAASSLRQMSSTTRTSRCQETDAQGQPVGTVRYGMEAYRDSSGRMLCRTPQNHTPSASCQPLDASGKNAGPSVTDAVPFKDPATNRTQCLHLGPGYTLSRDSEVRFHGEPDEVWWGCPLVPHLQFKHARQAGIPSGTQTCGDAEVIHDTLLEVRCAGYEKLKTSKVDPNDNDDGLNIAQWGSQAKQYAEEHSDAKDTLGFLYPDPANPDDVTASLTYLMMLADPIRTTAELKTGTCPAEMVTHVDNKEFCTESGMVGFHRAMDGAARDALDGRQRADANLMSGGMNEALRDAANARGQLSAMAEGGLASTFSRLQWSVAQSTTFYDPSGEDPTPGSPAGTFFWPAWRSRLVPSDLIGEALKVLSKSGDAKGLEAAAKALE